MDDDADRIVRQRQSKIIHDTNDSYSYSRCVNDMIKGKK
jgi:hypothetical protein